MKMMLNQININQKIKRNYLVIKILKKMMNIINLMRIMKEISPKIKIKQYTISSTFMKT